MSVTSLRFFLVILLLSSGLMGYAQEVIVEGVVLDKSSGNPVEFATVMVADTETGASLTGTTTGLDGTFSLKAPRKDFYVEVSFIGYNTERLVDLSIEGTTLKLGEIMLTSQSQLLETAVVRAEKSTTEFKLDKRVFNVGKDLSSTGASVLEVLNNVPSVTVTIEGEINLRGSGGVQVLINGKPSIIASEQGNALGTITAEMIERIEVITNPSAKYDAEGTSGIINIVLKKDERKGLNGAISVNTGVPDNHSVGLSLNRRTEKFNLFSQLGVGYRSLPNDVSTLNIDKRSGSILRTTGTEFRNEQYYNVVLGTDYYINETNVITLSGNFAYEVEDQPSNTNFELTSDTLGLQSRWNREETTEATNPKWQYELQYKRDFKDDKDHDLVVSFIGTFFGKDLTSEFLNTTLEGSDNSGRQQTRTNFSQADNTMKLDYTRPINDNWTLETGAQYVINDVSNDFAVSNRINDEWVQDTNFTNVFDWDQKVLAGYATAAYEIGKWGLKAGLRLENTDLETLLETTNESNEQNYTNFFPSAHTSYKFSDKLSVQAGYSRRVFRPRLWDLNPFFNIRNNFNIRTGNPDLQPEFTDSYEITSVTVLGKFSGSAGVYYRYTTEVVERVTEFLDDNVAITTPVNLGTNNSVGVELNAKYRASKMLTFVGDFNYNAFKRDGQLNDQNFDFSADQFNGRLTTKLDLPLDFDFEMTGNYRSAFQTVQGRVSEVVFMDLGLRKKLFDGKGALSFSARDLFASRIRESVIDNDRVFQSSRRLRGRFLTLGFSYGFGKGETMEYSGQRRR